mmetsp:Transcript_32962/g.75327  ORF Transcript_32962/g.75327 Transcript_32962/m.75327 type:complete len:122 (+) Transcript_32962:86-451(+)
MSFRAVVAILASLAACEARVGVSATFPRVHMHPAGLLQTERMQAAYAEAMMEENITQTAGMEGVACSPGDFARYKKIVCDVEAACGCADTKCELEWCAEYVHEWKKEFGACTLTACPPKAE